MSKLKKPNIIFFFTDQQRWDTVGCYGQKLDVTPNLDRMAAEGVKFEYAFSCQPLCGPARSALQTGKYPSKTGCFRNNVALPLDQKTIAHWFTEAGYEVGYIGKWHLASNGGPFKGHLGKGFRAEKINDPKIGMEYDYRKKPIPKERRGGWKDYWLAADMLELTSHGYDGYMFDGDMNKVEFKGYRVDCQTDFALNYLRTRNKEKPFFLFLSFLEPHHQNDHYRYEGPKDSKEKFKDYEVPGDLVDTEGDWRENYPDYLGCCNSLDYNLGRVLDELKKLNMGDNTIIFYTSDHGSHFRTRNKEYKRSCHEASIRVPMIVKGPGFSGGKVINNMVSIIDIPPTLLTCAGIEKPDVMDGKSLQTLVSSKSEDWPEEIFFQISETQVGRAIRTKKWKYYVAAQDKDGHMDIDSDIYVESELYDLENDPYEKNNLVQDPSCRKVKKELSKKLKHYINQIEGKSSDIVPAK